MQNELCSRCLIVPSNYKDAHEHVNPCVEFTKLDEAIILPNRPTSAMTSILPEEDTKAAKMKPRLMNNVKEETRSFLNFSRENLSVSHSDLEQGFNRSRQRPSRNIILSVSALLISLLCLGLVIWKLNSNAREIEQLKRDVDSLKFLELDLINEVKALKELYESSEDNDPGEADIDNADYDSNYDDYGSASHDYPDSSRTLLTHGSKPLGFLKTTTTPVPTSANPHKATVDDKHEQNLKIFAREHLAEKHRTLLNHDENNTEYKSNRDMSTTTEHVKENIKLKRSVSDHTMADDFLINTSNYHTGRYPTKKPIQSVSRARSYTSDESHMNNTAIIAFLEQISSTPRSPKKYHTHASLETFPLVHGQLSEAITRPSHRISENSEAVSGDERINWQDTRHKASRLIQKVAKKELRRRLTRRHLRAPRQVYAIHYGADSALFTAEDEHIGNGKVRHNNGVFKAWRPSDWVTELDMTRHFSLASDGKLTVHEPGLYLAYAQIHYLDEHDENGFRLLVNGRSILQCMVYSPGMGHKSRSCFSAQVTLLQAGDHLVLKDIGSARYTLFQPDKSFFGLLKLGEPRPQQQQKPHQPQQLERH